VALLAFEQSLSFEFDRTAEGISILVFKRGAKPMEGLFDDGSTGI
jgi:sulfate adenylyltransferase subunit 1